MGRFFDYVESLPISNPIILGWRNVGGYVIGYGYGVHSEVLPRMLVLMVRGWWRYPGFCRDLARLVVTWGAHALDLLY